MGNQKVCNNKDDCHDGSDERDCRKFLVSSLSLTNRTNKARKSRKGKQIFDWAPVDKLVQQLRH